MEHAVVLYNVLDGSYNWFLPGIGIGVSAFSSIIFLFFRWFYKKEERVFVQHERLFFNIHHPLSRNALLNMPRFIAVLSLILTVLTFIATYNIFISTKNNYLAGRYLVIEGEVDIREKSRDDNFFVDSKIFKYSNYNIPSSFTGLNDIKGSFTEGDYLKVYYKGEVIFRIDKITRSRN